MIDWFKIFVWSAATLLCIAFWAAITWAVTSGSLIAFLAVIAIGVVCFAGFGALCMYGFAGQGREA
jgi:hypothetical protein